MPPPMGCEGSSRELVEHDGITPLAGGHVVSRLCLSDAKEDTKSSRKVTVSLSCLCLLD